MVNELSKPNLPISKRLEQVIGQLDGLNEQYDKIGCFIKLKYAEIEAQLNPENDADLSREIKHHFESYIHHYVRKL